jgi:ParB/RepB/Spo0J family partition protein
MKSDLRNIILDRIKDPERPLRSNLTPESVDELVFSIKEVGIIEPLVVCESGDGFEVVAGHRRLLAAEIAGLIEVPCIVVNAKDLDKEVLKMHENIGREDINPIDWATQLTYLKQQYGLTDAKLAEMTGFSDSWVSQHLQILNYPEEILIAIKSGTLSFSAARELAQIKDEGKRKVYTNAAVKGGVTPGMAANWRRGANAQMPSNIEIQSSLNSGTELVPTELPLPVCPVCNTEILPQDIITLQVHRQCTPNSSSTST